MIISSLLFIVGLLIVIGITPKLIQWATIQNYLDHPDEFRKSHNDAVPRLGGIPLYLVFSLGCLFIIFYYPEKRNDWLIIYLCNSLLFFVGIWDDFRPLGAKVKLLAQVLIATTAFFLGLKIDLISYPLGGLIFSLGSWSIFFTVLWLISVPNLINLIDGMDGLASGLGMFLFLTLGFVGWSAGQLEVGWLCFSLAGALLGFLCFNFPPAKIFLGDGGAYLIGFVVATVSLTSANKGAIVATLLVTIIALGLPIMDTTFAILRRAVRGFPILKADSDHIHHRLQHIGLSKRRIVLGMYLISVVLSFMGLSVLWTQGRTLPIVGAFIFIMALIGARYLGYVWSWAEIKEQFDRNMIRRPEVQYTILLAKVLEMEVDRCEKFDQFHDCLETTLLKVGFHFKSEKEGLNLRPITIKFDPSYSLQLYVSDEEPLQHWTRLAHCFQEPYHKAMKKWKRLSET